MDSAKVAIPWKSSARINFTHSFFELLWSFGHGFGLYHAMCKTQLRQVNSIVVSGFGRYTFLPTIDLFSLRGKRKQTNKIVVMSENSPSGFDHRNRLLIQPPISIMGPEISTLVYLYICFFARLLTCFFVQLCIYQFVSLCWITIFSVFSFFGLFHLVLGYKDFFRYILDILTVWIFHTRILFCDTVLFFRFYFFI